MSPACILLIFYLHLQVCLGGRGLFSPRMEFPEWKPLGRGDPLTDPTNEYLPPVLERVRYWLASSSTTERLRGPMRYRPPPPPSVPLPLPQLVPPPVRQTTSWGTGSTTWEPPLPTTWQTPPPEDSSGPVLQALLLTEPTSTTSTTPVPTTVSPDPLFSLKKPTPPPLMYLIIQGHSKVKKYGASGSNLLPPHFTNRISQKSTS